METEGQKKPPRYGIVNFERRKYPRFSVDLPVEYYKIGSPVKHKGRAMNASQAGLLLYISFSKPELDLTVNVKLGKNFFL